MNTFFIKLKLIFHDTSLRRKIFFTLGLLALSRFFGTIPIPGVDSVALAQFFASNQFFGLLNVFSGGGLDQISIVMLGVGPYITGSIIMQLLTMMSPRLKVMYHEEGEAGKKRFSQYSRMLTVPLGLLQGFAFLTLLQRQGIVVSLSPLEFATNIIVVAAGSVLLMWLGELITEFGIGNGVSLLIFGGIVAQLPTVATQVWIGRDPALIPLYLGFFAAALAIIAGVIAVSEAERPVPVTYAKRVRGMRVYGGISTYLPLRLNQTGVIPIIFALSILLFPQMIAQFLSKVSNEVIAGAATFILNILSNGVFYGVFYFLLVFLFTYFYTAITFDPEAISSNLQKNGAFIPGVRPGRSTAEYLGSIVTRTTLVGALFLGIVAVLPFVMQAITGVSALAIGGTALLIVVSVVLDMARKIDAQVSMREY